MHAAAADFADADDNNYSSSSSNSSSLPRQVRTCVKQEHLLQSAAYWMLPISHMHRVSVQRFPLYSSADLLTIPNAAGPAQAWLFWFCYTALDGLMFPPWSDPRVAYGFKEMYADAQEGQSEGVPQGSQQECVGCSPRLTIYRALLQQLEVSKDGVSGVNMHDSVQGDAIVGCS